MKSFLTAMYVSCLMAMLQIFAAPPETIAQRLSSEPDHNVEQAVSGLKRDTPAITVPLILSVTLPDVLQFKEEVVPVEGLIRGVPTAIDISLPVSKFYDETRHEIWKSCSCFSAEFIRGDSQSGPATAIRVVAIPSQYLFREVLYIFDRDTARHDGSGEGPKYVKDLAKCSFTLQGKAITPVKVTLSSSTLPREGEERTVTIRPNSDSIQLVQGSTELSSSSLDCNAVDPPGDGSVVYRCTKRIPTTPNGKSEFGDKSEGIVVARYRYVLKGSDVEMSHRESLQLWSDATVRILPPQIILSDEDLTDGLKLKIVEIPVRENEEGFPYKIRFLSAGSQETISVAEVLETKVNSRGLWSVIIKVPENIANSRMTLIDVIHVDEALATRAASKVIVYGRK